MAINETIVTGRKIRKLVDGATKQWQRISFWHKASDCEFDDGKTAETKLGAIDGITDSLDNTSSRIAASAKSVAMLNNDLTALTDGGAITGMIAREDGVYITYKPSAGADAVTKKLDNRSGIVVTLNTTGIGSSGGTSITLTIKDSDGSTIYSQKVSNTKNNSLSYTFP